MCNNIYVRVNNQQSINENMTDNSSATEHISINEGKYLEELLNLLKIPSVSTQPRHKPDIIRTAKFIQSRLDSLNFETQIIDTQLHPVVFAEYKVSPNLPTILIYGHYDVQPAEPFNLWENPPFEPIVKQEHIFARGASDDKGQLYAHVCAADCILKTTGTLPVNLKFVFEGAEEMGSLHFPKFVKDHKELLSSDVVIVSDSDMIAPNTPTISYAVRGLVYATVKITTAKIDLHSGIYGGGVPNAINTLARIITKMKDSKGNILINGFYDDVDELTLSEIDKMAKVPFNTELWLNNATVKSQFGEPKYTLLQRIWARPTLDCNGIIGGYTEEGSKTIIPAEATAKISCRLVPKQKPDEIAKKIETFIENVTPSYADVEITWHNNGDGSVTDIESSAVKSVAKALSYVFDKKTIYVRSGGSIPAVPAMENHLKTPVILVGFGDETDRKHAPNEKFAVRNFYIAIRSSVAILNELRNINKLH